MKPYCRVLLAASFFAQFSCEGRIPLDIEERSQALAAPNTAPVAVHRWWHAGDKDWASIAQAGLEPTPSQMAGAGFTNQTLQFYAYLIGTEQMSAIYRWRHPSDADWITVPDGSPSDAFMMANGYGQKTFQFYAYNIQIIGTVPVHRWWHQGDRDWVLIAEGEISDATMAAWGYTNKTLVFYAFCQKDPGIGYFPLSSPTTVMSKVPWQGTAPHTMSVVELNREGFRYWGYYGLQEWDGIWLAFSNDLLNWTRETTPLFPLNHQRWSSAVLRNGVVHLVYDEQPGGPFSQKQIVYRSSTDGRTFTSPVVLVTEPLPTINQNATLFYSQPTSWLLYWYRSPNGDGTPPYEIWSRFAFTPSELVNGTNRLVASTPARTAAPQLMFWNNLFYLAVETEENSPSGLVWKTRILKSVHGDRDFVEIPGNPILTDGSACLFQHTFGTTLHAYYCKLTGSNWTLDYRTGNLSTPN
jgi:hypothetical protein